MTFIEKANKIHNGIYDYSLVQYKNNKTKVKIICPIHGEFEQRPDNHLHGYGCKKCGYNKGSRINLKKTTSDFIKQADKIHNNKYDYSLVNYTNNSTNIKIICPVHGEFEQRPLHHLNGSGCQVCSKNKKFSTLSFVEKCSVIHNNKYDYSLVKYKNMISKVEIICPIHGKFKQIARKHMEGRGCRRCNDSKGEKIIESYLIKNNILFEKQKTFTDCKYKKSLYFDFYLKDLNYCIEYDGEQHYIKYRWEKDESNLNIRKKRDSIKNNYCIYNNIKLLRISYKDDILEKLKVII